ncbi:hypothetical protein D3C84_783660 [compost metagenome]
MITAPMLPTARRMSRNSTSPASSWPAPLSSGSRAIKGIAAMSWNSRMAKASRPWGLVSSLRSASICRPKAVDESARPKPSTAAVFRGRANTSQATAPMARAVSSTWARPTPNTERRITQRRLGESSRPMMKSSSTTPSSETWATLSRSVTRRSTEGPISTPPSR